MDTLDAIERRRSIKHFDPDHRISEEEVTALLEATLKSPTSFNIQHWRFVVIDDPELRKQVRAHGNDQAQMTDASLLVLMTADLKAWAKSPERYWVNAPKAVSDLLVGWMGPFHEGDEELQRDEAMRSIGIAMQTLMLAATAKGYQSCPMIGFDRPEVAKLVNLPDDHVIGPLVAIGKGTQEAWARGGQLPLDEVVVKNRFS
ncbi:MAG: nitroreductase family protein [Acidobacteriota bacterium]